MMEEEDDLQHLDLSGEIEEAKQKMDRLTAGDNTPHDLINIYRDWSQDNSYDKDISGRHRGAALCAESAAHYLVGQHEALILDVGAGTGLVGLELSKRGFTNVEALDPSEDMLNIAAEKKVYKKMHNSYFSHDMSFLETNTYDAITSSAAVGFGHIQMEALKEFIRIVKPGGYVFIASNILLLAKGKEVIEEMLRLGEQHQWRQLERREVNKYWIEENGLMFVFEVTKKE